VLAQAARWCAAPNNRPALAALLARPDRVGVRADVIARSLEGRIRPRPDEPERYDPTYVVFPEDGMPTEAQTRWLAAAMREAGQSGVTDALVSRVLRVELRNGP
jgi:two-component system, oxyanion-binding sensor